jgi:hypothetical protein
LTSQRLMALRSAIMRHYDHGIVRARNCPGGSGGDCSAEIPPRRPPAGERPSAVRADVHPGAGQLRRVGCRGRLCAAEFGPAQVS